MAFLELKDIYKSYFLGREEFPVLKGINLSFDKGEFVSILGESGGGKTTLMNIIGGLDRLFSGTVKVGGHVLNHDQEKELDVYRRKTIGYIFQSFNLINYQTNLENVETSLNMTTLTRSQRKHRAAELLKKVGLGEHLNKYPSQLSGGQKQRVAIARALAGDPDIMIADEPTGALDSGNTNEVLELLDEIAQEGKLVIVVTHSQDVANYGTRIVHMEDGQIGKTERLKPRYRLSQYGSRNRGAHSRPLSRRTIWDMAFDHLKFKKLQNFLIILGSSIGLGAVILFLGLGNGVKGYIEKQITDTFNPNYPTVTKRVSTDNNLSDEDEQSAVAQAWSDDYASLIVSDDNIARLSKVAHVKNVYAGYQFSGATFTVGEQKKTGALYTWSPAFQDNLLKAGSKPTKDGEIVIDQTFAKKINKNWKAVIGQTVTVNYTAADKAGTAVAVNGTAKVVGITKANQGIYGMTANSIKTQLTNAGALTGYNYVPVEVDETTNVKATTNAIKKLQDNNHQIFDVRSIGDSLTQINTITSLASKVLAAIAGISLIVSAIMIIVTTYMSVAERTQEIGVLRALGARAKDIRALFTNEALLMGIIAAGLAIVVALLVQTLMNSILYTMISYNIVKISGGDILLAVIMSIVIAWIASYVPSRQAARLNTIDALSSN